MENTGAIAKKGSCPLCLSPNDRWMIECDGEDCGARYHLRCVGLNYQAKRKSKWFCGTCEIQGCTEQTLVDFSFGQPLSSTKMYQENDDNVTVIEKKVNSSNPFLSTIEKQQSADDFSYTLVPNTTQHHEETRVSLRRTKSQNSSHARSKSKLELLKKQEELYQKEQENVRKQLQLLETMSDTDSDSSDIFSPNDEPKKNETEKNKKEKDTPYFKLPGDAPPPYSSIGYERQQEITPPTNFPSCNVQNVSTNPFLNNNPVNNVEIGGIGLRQWSARHTLPKTLPTFTGKPDEWVTFISAYEHANDSGHFTNGENLPRLEACIKGAAREFVKGLFTSADNVPEIIDTLRRIFGRPIQLLRVNLDEIRNTRKPDPEKPETVLLFAVSVQNLWSSMKAAKMSAHMDNPQVMQELVDMLPQKLKYEWGKYLIKNSNDMTSFTQWLRKLSDNICEVNPMIDLTRLFDNKNVKKRESVNVNVVTTKSNCLVCDKGCPAVDMCDKFLLQDVKERWNTVLAKGLCRKCLSKHVIKPPYRCAAEKKCDIDGCPGGHHPLVHRDQVVTRILNHHVSHSESVRFRYVPVKLINGDKVRYEFAFMDSGSSGTFMESDLASELGLCGPTSDLCIKHTSDKTYFEQESMRVSVTICGTFEKAQRHSLVGIQTMEKLCLNEQTLNYEILAEQYQHIKGLPVESYTKAKPRLLIGLNNWPLGIPTKVRYGKTNEPIAARCKLGWTVYAATTNEDVQSINYCDVNTPDQIEIYQRDIDLHKLVRNFFAIESLGVSPPMNEISSIELRLAFDILKNTTVFDEGRVETGLLWRDEATTLPDSFPTAMRRLKCLEYRMSRDENLAKAAQEQIDKYVSNGYLRKLTTEELNAPRDRKWYLPMFPITNPNKPGRFRMVFDAAQEVNGVSLNSVLLQGPDLGASLIAVLMRFRQHRIAISGDIKDMFMRVGMKKEDQHCQRVLWRDNPQEPPSTYVLQTLTFGAKCSPTSAIYAKNTNAEQFRDEYPRAVEAICENHYVDDFMDSVPTEQEAIDLANQVKMIHQNAGFFMHQWHSNSVNFVNEMNGTTQPNPVNLNLDHEQMQKVLGLWWLPESDHFTFSLKYNKGPEAVLRGEQVPTKRDVMRILMSLYDPLGLLTHFTSYLKVLLQNIWRSKVTFDERIEDYHVDQWNLWLQVLPQVEDLRIPRCYLKDMQNYDDVDNQLHIFVDASRTCSAAVAYLRIDDGSKVVCSLIMAKSRVAPMKLISVPKLELVAALLGARLSKTIISSLKVKISKTVYWSDSRPALLWLRSDTMKLPGQFEQFKVAEIQDITEISNWRYVPSKMNVADDATKWQKSFRLDNNSRWFNGPAFLYENESKWPEDVTLKTQLVHHVVVNEVVPSPCLKYESYRSWKHICRALSYCYRSLNVWILKVIMRQSIIFDKNILTSDELQDAETSLIKCIQSEAYKKEIDLLLKHKPVPKNSSLYTLSPVLDEGVLKIEGRTAAVLQPSPYDICDESTQIPPSVTSPIILPKDHFATWLLVEMYHIRFRHIQHETVVNEIRQRFHISQLRPLVRKITKECNTCKILYATPAPPRMAALPKARLSPYTPVFTYTGIDCFGPIEVVVGRRHEKRWVVLFTCLTVRAVHLEIIHGMDHDSFIMALRNFMQRRGEPREIFSDNGTNFVKGERILREEYEKIAMDKVAKEFVSPQLKWNFNPPESQHMGGSWERLVRSIKQAFYSIPHARTMNDQLLRCYLMEAENIVNSRPLTYVPLNSENEEALTPNHFLRGSSGGGKPIGSFRDDAKFLRSNWMTAQLYAKKFWKKWIVEYLPDLTRRSKWYDKVEPLKEGDICLIVDPESHRNHWPKGRVAKVNTSQDGQVRSAVVKLVSGFLSRPATKIAKLDILGSKASHAGIEGGVLDVAAVPETSETSKEENS